MWKRRSRNPSSALIAALALVVFLVLPGPVAFADKPTSSTDTFQTTATNTTATPVNACVIHGDSTASGFVFGTGLFNGSTFSGTSSFNQNNCTNTSNFTGSIIVTNGVDTINFSVIGIATGPSTAFGKFQAFSGTGNFPECGQGTVTGVSPISANFDGKYHFTHNCGP